MGVIKRAVVGFAALMWRHERLKGFNGVFLGLRSVVDPDSCYRNLTTATRNQQPPYPQGDHSSREPEQSHDPSNPVVASLCPAQFMLQVAVVVLSPFPVLSLLSLVVCTPSALSLSPDLYPFLPLSGLSSTRVLPARPERSEVININN